MKAPASSPRKRRAAPAARRQATVASLARASIALGGSRDPERILQLVADSARGLFDNQQTSIALLREDSHQRLELAFTEGLSAAFQDVLRGWLQESAGRLEAVLGARPAAIGNLARAGRAVPAAQRAIYQSEGIQALVTLPLLAQGDAVGVLSLYFGQVRRFSPAELELLRSFGSLAGLAIANARVYAGIELALIRYSQQLQALKAVNRELNAALDLPHLLKVVVERARAYTGAEAGCLHLWDAEKGRLNLAASDGYAADLRNQPEAHSALRQLAERARRNGRPELIGDLAAEPVLAAPAGAFRSHLSVPVRHEGAALAVISLEDSRFGCFTEDHVGFISQLAGQTAIALVNARLFAAVSENHDRLLAVLNSTREGVLVVDAAGRIALANPRIEEFWGVSRAALIDHNLADLLQDRSLGIAAHLGFTDAELLELLINLSQKLPVAPSKHTYHVESPALRFLERSSAPVIDQAGQVIGWVLVVRDVTEEKQAELAREDLTGMIVHDLRSPMTTVFGSLKLIDDVYVNKDETGFLREAVTISLRSSKRMVALVDSLLDVFKTDSGRIELRLRPHSLPDLAEGMVEEFQTFATLTDVNLVNRVPPDLPPVLIDAEKVERVLTNLIDNALKFTPADGTVTLSAGLDGDDDVRIEVSDTGPGIPAEYAERVFDRYVKVSGREGRRRGTGLGLAFCKLAVEAHGGRIWVENNPEGGSRFIFTLPLAGEV